MIKAVEFFNLFFTNEMITNIVTHTNTYAWEHIYLGPIRVIQALMVVGKIPQPMKSSG